MGSTISRLYEKDTYRVFKNGRFDYTAVKPRGDVITVCFTLRGAKRAIRKHKSKAVKWWDAPIVHEEDE